MSITKKIDNYLDGLTDEEFRKVLTIALISSPILTLILFSML